MAMYNVLVIGICLLCVTWYASKYMTLKAVQQEVDKSPPSKKVHHPPVLLPKFPPISMLPVSPVQSPPHTPTRSTTSIRLPEKEVGVNDPGHENDFDVRDVPMFTTRHQLLNSES